MKVLRNVQKKSKRNPKNLASTTTTHTTDHVYYFGSFCLNPVERRLLRNGESIRLTPKVFDTLLVLIQNKGRLVTKGKFLKEVWPDSFVEEANLSVNIASLRKALDEGIAERQYIETVPKCGYRFVAPVSELSDESAGTVNPRPSEESLVRTELIDVMNGWQLWGEQYHTKLSDILVIQEEIAAEISERSKVTLTVDEKRLLTKRQTNNSEACHLYLKGRYQWNRYAQKGLCKAIEYFSRAIDLDPTYALAYAGLADSYCRLSDTYCPTREVMPKAKLAARKALEINETLAEAHAALGMVLMSYDWEWVAAEQEFSRAIELNPGYAIAHQRLALYFNLLGRFDEAMGETQLAIELDPLSLQTSQSVAFEYFLKGDYEQAIEQQEKTLEVNASYHPAYYMLGWVYKRKGDLSKAIDSFSRATVLDDCPLFLGALAHAYGLNGNRIKALSILDELEELSKRRYVSSYSRAVVYIGLDEKDQAFYWLEKAVSERSAMLTCLKVGCEFDGLRADPRLLDLLRRVGLS